MVDTFRYFVQTHTGTVWYVVPALIVLIAGAVILRRQRPAKGDATEAALTLYCCLTFIPIVNVFVAIGVMMAVTVISISSLLALIAGLDFSWKKPNVNRN
jgi:hypothetical protein